eukprot:CAMPEP_0168730150 /NCGR_PEP_ID=MMETSP0724-20121128/6585_1 /TAXON_ID=265536 /ORGANISM="Amphiprora sp., Strain CCMP467" /LENGTH=1089 /DNA_ID=CAMNT_0008777085 /DNA_START=192 /DNA_END=3461 /DNA_ORIENTATION=-
MADIHQNAYFARETGGRHHSYYPAPLSQEKPPNAIVRAATEESEETARHDSHHYKHVQMRPPAFQRPIPTKPDGYCYYHQHRAPPPQHDHAGHGQTSPGYVSHRRHLSVHHTPSHAGSPLRSGHHHSPSGPRHSVQSVITSSFSIEDGSNGQERGYHPVERRHDTSTRAFRTTNSDSIERREPPNFVVATTAHTESPKQGGHIGRNFSSLSRSFSSGSEYCNTTPPMKRTFFHHAKASDMSPSSLPPEFVPPKRTKAESTTRKEVTITPRLQQPEQAPSAWFRPSWEAREEEENREREAPMDEYHGPPSYPWDGPIGSGHSPIIHRPAARLPTIHTSLPPLQYGPSRDHESPHSYSWNHSPSASWGGPFSPSHEPQRHFWGSPSHSWQQQQHRDDTESVRGVMYRSYRSGPDARDPYEGGSPMAGVEVTTRDQQIFRAPSNSSTRPSGDDKKMKIMMENVSFADSVVRTRSTDGHPDNDKPLMLLSLPQDKVALSETLCVVRENVEVFTATQADVDAPAPGRKHAVVVGQVGLRCIHCRHTTKASDRVKRAVCYPSSVKRIYRTIIDMKLDHFSQCKFVPQSLKEKLDKLKAVHTRSTGTTMQYFIKAAGMLGMEDSDNGVILNLSKKVDLNSEQATKAITEISKRKSVPPQPSKSSSFSGESLSSTMRDIENPPRPQNSVPSLGSFGDGSISSEPLDDSGKYFDGVVPLSLPEDKSALSQLRCFLREQVCAFTATDEDIAVRAPTTFQISKGQVGIGCIHCVRQPPKYRSNRAVCFPFSINRIYQSVADIQRFHSSECKRCPQDIKEKFLALQNASSKGSKGLATRQYWVASARKLGLVDTSKGIRFNRDPSEPQETKSFSLDILAQAAFSVTTTNKKLVLPEDKEKIAEFLYAVMEQLQPCRFTEADRNKRRDRNIGCIGVECKHCAGRVDSRKFFWSSVSAVESNFVSVHTHMLECRYIPARLKEQLVELKKKRKSQTAELMTGSQKAFFNRVWQRLHKEEIVPPNQKSPEKKMETIPKQIGESISVDSVEFAVSSAMESSSAGEKKIALEQKHESPSTASVEPMDEDRVGIGHTDSDEPINTMQV